MPSRKSCRKAGHLMRQAGLELMQLIMDNEVRQTAGERYQGAPQQPFRWGREFLVVDGQNPSSVRACVARTATSNAWAATSCSAAPTDRRRRCKLLGLRRATTRRAIRGISASKSRR